MPDACSNRDRTSSRRASPCGPPHLVVRVLDAFDELRRQPLKVPAELGALVPPAVAGGVRGGLQQRGDGREGFNLRTWAARGG